MNKKITTAFEAQRQACEMLGSPLMRDVVGFCADNFAANGVIAELVRGWQGDPLNDNVPLRLAKRKGTLSLSGSPCQPRTSSAITPLAAKLSAQKPTTSRIKGEPSISQAWR